MEMNLRAGASVAPKTITVSLRRPSQSTPVQKWTFEDKSVIKIGRAGDNDVVLYSSVVSRYHVEVRYKETHWEIVSFGDNGTYFNGRPLAQASVVDGMIVCLAGSGPRLQIHLGTTAEEPMQKTAPSQQTVPQKPKDKANETFIRA